MHNDIHSAGSISILDRIRADNGAEMLRTCFVRYIEAGKAEAAALLNDENLKFATLFLLEPYIRQYDLYGYLNRRNIKALEFMDAVKAGSSAVFRRTEEKSNICTCCAIKWILCTGFSADGMNSRYDDILERAAAVLTKTYSDSSLLYVISDMIFARYRRGIFCHNLIWALFECRSPQCLYHIASYLCSTSQRDVELAHRLLGFIPGMDAPERESSPDKYRRFLIWFDQNHLYLHYTGESFQQTGTPIPYAL